MPFMIGRAPIRRTLKYLEAGELYLKSKIQIFSVNYNTYGENHQGTRDFVFWKIPQVQYKNPEVQIITFRNMTPTPFVKLYYEDGEQLLIDVDNKSKEQIMRHLVKVAGKSVREKDAESLTQRRMDNCANFGVGAKKSCMCVVFGQVPCPTTVPLPYHMRGKYAKNKEE